MPQLLEAQIADLHKYWMKLLSSVSSNTGTSIAELQKIDVFQFFSLLQVVDEKTKK